MAQLASGVRVARRVAASAFETINVMGPSIQFLSPLEEADDAPCLMRGTIPPGVAVPLHSHADSGTFLQVSGEVEALVEAEGGFDWVRVRAGDVFYAPGGAKHAFRNQGQEPAVMILVSTCRIGRFFREISVPAASAAGAPSGETIRHFLKTFERYGYWNATPEENVRVGISLPV
jgi:quercetin dioxygenase-like cupin family protein